MLKNIEALELMQINPDFENKILSNIPEGLNKLEQGLYVYAKLCALLDYDSRFFASEQEGTMSMLHSDINYISSVSEDNPNVVCYNFNLICIRMLEKIGVKAVFTHGTNFDDADKYYGTHSDIYMLVPEMDESELPYGLQVGEEIVLFGHSDMSKIKVENRLTPRLLNNRNKCSKDVQLRTKQEFDSCVERIKDIVIKETEISKKQQNEEKLNREKLAELEDLYKSYIDRELDFLNDYDKINIFLEQVGKIDLGDIAAMKYATQLYKQIECDLENPNKYGFTVIKQRESGDVYGMVGIVSCVGVDQNFYIKITPPNEMSEIKHRDLQAGFDSGEFDYISAYFNANLIIPEIKSDFLIEHTDLNSAREQLYYHRKTGKWIEVNDKKVPQRLIDYVEYIDGNMRDKSFDNSTHEHNNFYEINSAVVDENKLER